MIRKILPFAAAVILVLIFIVAFTGGARQTANPTAAVTTTTTDVHVHEGTAPTTAPQPIVPPAGASKITVVATPADKTTLGDAITATITSPAGKPVGDATIRFYDVVELFGQREELIGTAQTDGQGSALIYYLPASTGTHTIVARFNGQGTLGASLGVKDVDATLAAPAYKTDQQPLAAFSHYVPYVAATIVVSVWALIAFSLLGTARGVFASRGTNNIQRKGDTA